MKNVVHIRFIFIILLAICSGSCDRSSDNPPTRADMPYKSRYPVQHIDSEHYKPGYIVYDSNQAASSPTVSQAIERWKQYVEEHPEPEDGFSSNYLIGAKIDLMRAYYLAGEIDKGDEILDQFDLTTLEHKKTTDKHQ